MNLSNEQFDKAFAEYQLFGPRRRIPIENRWQEILPSIEANDYPALKAQCKDIEAFAFVLAEEVTDKKTTAEAAMTKLSEKYPFLTQERLGQTWSQAMYYVAK